VTVMVLFGTQSVMDPPTLPKIPKSLLLLLPLGVLLALDGGQYLSLVLHGSEFEIPDPLPCSRCLFSCSLVPVRRAGCVS